MEKVYLADSITRIRENILDGKMSLVACDSTKNLMVLRAVLWGVKIYGAEPCLAPHLEIATGSLLSIKKTLGCKVLFFSLHAGLVALANEIREYRSEFDIVSTYALPFEAEIFLDRKEPPAVTLNIPEWWSPMPRVCAPWNDEEDKILRMEVVYGMSVPQIAKRHGRAEGGIRSRIPKLFGPDFLVSGYIDTQVFDQKKRESTVHRNGVEGHWYCGTFYSHR
jgi:hypothetical protein